MKRFFTIFIFISGLFCISTNTASHASTAESAVHIYGTVQDSVGTALANATVTFTSESSTTKAVTDSSGYYSALLTTVITGVDEPSAPQAFTLHQNYPNPFNPSTTIEYELKEPAVVKLTVYNISGQLIRTLQDGYESVGLHRAVWDGRDELGSMVAAGVYLYCLEAGNAVHSKKMVLMDGGGSGSVVSKVKRMIQGAPKVAKLSDMPYEITVEKPGYILHTGDSITATETSPEQEKNFVLYRIDPSLPYADAGPDMTARMGSYIILDGSGSYQGDGEMLEYEWSVDFDNPFEVYIFNVRNYESKAEIAFYAEGTYNFLLTVDNGIQESEPDSITITVLPREESIFEDPNLEIAIRYQLHKPVGEITETELASLDSMRYYSIASFNNIKSIQGIEKCNNLT